MPKYNNGCVRLAPNEEERPFDMVAPINSRSETTAPPFMRTKVLNTKLKLTLRLDMCWRQSEYGCCSKIAKLTIIFKPKSSATIAVFCGFLY